MHRKNRHFRIREAQGDDERDILTMFNEVNAEPLSFHVRESVCHHIIVQYSCGISIADHMVSAGP
jgi:hypothetical protein